MIEFCNVSFAYPDSADGGLKNINLTIPDGQCVLLCGRSGCGKTTLTRLINGLIPQFFAGELQGEILLDGEDLADLPMYRIAEKVGSVFQNPRTQFFNVDTDSEIAFGMENGTVPQKPKERMKRSYLVMQDVNDQLFAESVEAEGTFGIKRPDTALAEKTREELGLSPFRERHPNTLSGGQKQRLAVASAVVCGKQLLVFDEPTSGLDYESMVCLSSLIRRLSDTGKVIFIVTHDYEFVCRTYGRVLHLDGGGIQDDLTVAEENLPKIRGIFEVR